jgi:hypothetical protein
MDFEARRAAERGQGRLDASLARHCSSRKGMMGATRMATVAASVASVATSGFCSSQRRRLKPRGSTTVIDLRAWHTPGGLISNLQVCWKHHFQ